MTLESPPIYEVLLLESPWSVMVVCGVVAVMLFSAGQRRQNKGLMIGASGALVLAAGVYLLATAVTTDREHLKQHTRDLVAATAPLNEAELDRLIDPTAVVTGPDGQVWVKAGDVLPRARSVLTRVSLLSQDIRLLDAVGHDNGWGESTVTIQTQASSGNAVNTGWLLSWRKDDGADGAWRVIDIRWMRFNGVKTPMGVMP